MQAFYKSNKTNNTSGIREEKRNYSGITSRKILNMGKQICTVFRRRRWVKAEREPPPSFRLFHISCGPDVRKLLHPPLEMARNGRKSLPISQVPCSLEACDCQGISLESSFTANPWVSRCYWRKNDMLLMLSKPHEYLIGRTYTLSELRVKGLWEMQPLRYRQYPTRII